MQQIIILHHKQNIYFKRNTQQVWSRGDVNLSKQCSLCSFVAAPSAAHSDEHHLWAIATAKQAESERDRGRERAHRGTTPKGQENTPMHFNKTHTS